MTTEKQPQQTIETAFGTATLTDWRDYSDPTESARLHFESLTINRKEYGHFNVDVSRFPDGSLRLVPNNGYNTRLTDAAREKLMADLSRPELVKLYEPYLEPLDEGDIRDSLKGHLAGRVLHHIYGELPYKPEAYKDLGPVLMDEILKDIVTKRADGMSYYDIMMSR